MNQRDKLIVRLKSDTFYDQMLDESVRKDTKINILSCVDKRVFNGITQEDMAKSCNVSLSTIKRFENLQVNDLILYFNYQYLLQDLPNSKRKPVPRWVY